MSKIWRLDVKFKIDLIYQLVISIGKIDSIMKICPSDEQREYINALKNNNNIFSDCCAGSGKTTTALCIAEEYSTKKILQVTYNSHLKLEVRKKINKMNINNMEIHSYNSLVFKYYNDKGYDDKILKDVIKNNTPPKSHIPEFDIIIIDEAQDMIYAYKYLLSKFFKDMSSNNHKYLLVILGDKNQGIYQFKGSDSRFLTLADKIWDNGKFVFLKLSTTYRLTNTMASFVNDVMLGENRLHAIKDGVQVKYIECNIFRISEILTNKIICMLKNGIKPEDIFILAYSIKSEKGPVKLIENKLVIEGIPCFYPTSDDTILNDSIINGKIVFSTFHQSKGRERKIVIIYGFDHGYFKYFAKEQNHYVCPDLLYVATTRATKELILLQDINQGPLPFLKKPLNIIRNLDYVDFESYHNKDIHNEDIDDENSIMTEKHRISTVDFVKFLNEDSIDLLTPLVDILYNTEKKPYYKVDILLKIPYKENMFEDVSDINGIMIPAYYEKIKNGISTVEKLINYEYDTIKSINVHKYLENAFNELKKYEGIPYYTYQTVLYSSLKEKVYNKLAQINNFDWITEEILSSCKQSLDILEDDIEYEHKIKYICKEYPQYGEIEFNGIFDAISKNNIYELKCVEKLTIENCLQLIVYQWLWSRNNNTDYRSFKLVNIKTGEIKILNQDTNLIKNVIEVILKNKYGKRQIISDSEFVKKCNTINSDNKNVYLSNDIYDDELVEKPKRFLTRKIKT